MPLHATARDLAILLGSRYEHEAIQICRDKIAHIESKYANPTKASNRVLEAYRDALVLLELEGPYLEA